MPRHTFQHSAITSAPVSSVWRALDEPGTWEAVPGVDRVLDPVWDPEGKLYGFSFESIAAGKKYLGRAIAAGRDHERLMAFDINTSELRGKVTVGLSEFEGDTRVYVKLDVESVGLLASVFFPAISAAIGNGFTQAVDEFAGGFSDSA